MAKNITVIGENGNILYSTYPKRAKGLVKKGRAHWVSEEVIRMRADNEEVNEMANNIYEILIIRYPKCRSSSGANSLKQQRLFVYRY